MKLWAMVVDVRERASNFAYPVVQHVFYGRTQAEALRYYQSHLRTDEFLRDCVEKRRWKQVECVAEMQMFPPE